MVNGSFTQSGQVTNRAYCRASRPTKGIYIKIQHGIYYSNTSSLVQWPTCSLMITSVEIYYSLLLRTNTITVKNCLKNIYTAVLQIRACLLLYYCSFPKINVKSKISKFLSTMHKTISTQNAISMFMQ